MSGNPSIINPISLPTSVHCLRKISIVNPAVAIFTKDETINRIAKAISKNYGNDLETKLNEILKSSTFAKNRSTHGKAVLTENGICNYVVVFHKVYGIPKIRQGFSKK